ncbi:hypothetical protein FG93_03857 [Bosea sp. LC85]|nr:hypothetical protein FG93_03857 [Bosea sp. LC85]
MGTVQRVCLLIASGILLSGCQATQYRSAQLAPVCAIPVNRTIQSMYWPECLSVYSSSDRYSKHY